MLDPRLPALVLAPMDGITDAPMRALQGEVGAFDWCVTEFIRVSADVLPPKAFRREVPEITSGCVTATGLPVQIQLLGGDPDRMAASAAHAVTAGATAIDINFGCPAPTVNRHDGGASLLRHPERIEQIVRAVRSAVPPEIPVSAKLRLGWESIDDIHENAARAAAGGASWLTIHARTRMQSYRPPVFWPHVGQVRRSLGLPIIANGDIWTREDFLRCREETGCHHFMLGRASLANPLLSHQVRAELGLPVSSLPDLEWAALFEGLVKWSVPFYGEGSGRTLLRLKQWMKLASLYGHFPDFDTLKLCETLPDLLTRLPRLAEAV